MKFVRRTLVALALVAATITIGTPNASAAENCYGSGCVGLDPANTTCVNDAKTIRAINVNGYGMLQMRWSKACNSGWARYTNYRRPEQAGLANGMYSVKRAYVSAWTDQGTQDSIGLPYNQNSGTGSSWWGRMVDFGRPEVCVGVRQTMQAYDIHSASGMMADDPLDWVWGPCVR
ncbi:MAG TPA: DUF2690 domain-containing protein [Candidatus Saccharimonadales bacterium]|nr:DUF2690 domain-containing protein [Candidatus Saccharimonadales bacterium]